MPGIQLTARCPALLTGLLVASVSACAGDPPLTNDAEVAASVPVMSTEMPSDLEAIRPFTIEVPGEVLADLQDRLSRTRLPDQIPGSGWDYGTDGAYLQELLTYWQDGFDWRAQEQILNQFDHFRTALDRVDLHFIHQRSPVEDATPLLLTHGWPGSFTEFTEIIGPLTDPASHGGAAADAFHLVIPSLPGFGLSSKPAERGYNPERMADLLAQLMERLGYERYGAQGGDWGAIINRILAFKYEDRLIGLHSNFVTGDRRPIRRTPRKGCQPRSWSCERNDSRSGLRGAGTPRSKGPSRKRWGTPCRIRRRVSPPGSSRSSTDGVTMAVTSSARSRRISS